MRRCACGRSMTCAKRKGYMKTLRFCFWVVVSAVLVWALLAAWVIGVLFVWVMQALHP